MTSPATFEERIDRWIDALCANVRVFEDRALDPRWFESATEESPTDELRIGFPARRPTSSLS